MSTVIYLQSPQTYVPDTPVTKGSDGKPVSYIYDEKWDYTAMRDASASSRTMLSFAPIKKALRPVIQRTVFAYQQYYVEQKKKIPSVSELGSMKSGLLTIAECLNTTDWAALSDDKVFSQFKRRLKKLFLDKGFGEGKQIQINSSISKLNTLQFCDRHITSKDLGLNGVVNQSRQAIAVPLRIYASLLSQALATVEKYHPHRHEISLVMAKAHEIADKERAKATVDGITNPKVIGKRVTSAIKKIHHTIPDFQVTLSGAQLGQIQYQCAILILAFSGMRNGELLSLDKHSYRMIRGVPVLQGKASKGSDGKPKRGTWQTHPVAKDVLELANDMTEFARSLHQENLAKLNANAAVVDRAKRHICLTFVTGYIGLEVKRFVNTGLSQRISRFFSNTVLANEHDVEEFDRLNPSRAGSMAVGGGLPKLTTHDVRRTFAVFFKRYGFGSLAAIKFQFKHENIQMSDYYANNAYLQHLADVQLDKELLALLEEEGVQMGIDIFDDIYNKSEVLSGAAGKRIANDKFKKLQGGHQVYFNRNEMAALVRNGTLSAVKLPTGGYCLNSECSRVCGIGEFAADTSPCKHKVYTDREAKRLRHQTKRLIETFRGLNNGDKMYNSILIGLKQKIKLNENIFNEHNISFERFADEVAGLINVEII